jgi:formate hydrogenlyase transcriptional activator
LLEVSESIAAHRDLSVLFRDLAERLPRIVCFDSLWLVLRDDARNRMRLHVLEGPGPATADEEDLPIERSMEESPSGLVWSTQQPLVVPNLALDRRYP